MLLFFPHPSSFSPHLSYQRGTNPATRYHPYSKLFISFRCILKLLEVLITTEHGITSKIALFGNSPFSYCNEANAPDKVRPVTSNTDPEQRIGTVTAPVLAPREDSSSGKALTGLPLAAADRAQQTAAGSVLQLPGRGSARLPAAGPQQGAPPAASAAPAPRARRCAGGGGHGKPRGLPPAGTG